MKVKVETVQLTKKVYFVEVADDSPAVWKSYPHLVYIQTYKCPHTH